MQHLDLQTAHSLLTGHLSAPDQTRWERHLRECERCRDLLANERSMRTLMGLGDSGEHPVELRVDALLDRVPRLAPARAARRRLRRWNMFTGILAVALAGLLALQIGHRATTVAATDTPRIPAGVESQVVAELGELLALERDPWLAEDYETVRTLERLILQPSGD